VLEGLLTIQWWALMNSAIAKFVIMRSFCHENLLAWLFVSLNSLSIHFNKSANVFVKGYIVTGNRRMVVRLDQKRWDSANCGTRTHVCVL
jgi:hypothetical protein